MKKTIEFLTELNIDSKILIESLEKFTPKNNEDKTILNTILNNFRNNDFSLIFSCFTWRRVFRTPLPLQEGVLQVYGSSLSNEANSTWVIMIFSVDCDGINAITAR